MLCFAGFVPIAELSKKWENVEATRAPHSPDIGDEEEPPIETDPEPAAQEQGSVEDTRAEVEETGGGAPEDLPGHVDEIPEREHSATSKLTNQSGASPGRLELEPITKPKKGSVLKKMNSRGSVAGSDTR
jgi:hypothetical protein